MVFCGLYVETPVAEKSSCVVTSPVYTPPVTYTQRIILSLQLHIQLNRTFHEQFIKKYNEVACVSLASCLISCALRISTCFVALLLLFYFLNK